MPGIPSPKRIERTTRARTRRRRDDAREGKGTHVSARIGGLVAAIGASLLRHDECSTTRACAERGTSDARSPAFERAASASA
eukprot:31377-Pelagococcus_subviridis.AAC.8